MFCSAKRGPADDDRLRPPAPSEEDDIADSLPLISTIATGLGLAFVCGLVADRLKIPALVGYLVAGIVIGPYTPGFVADVPLASELAEIGVMLLMFGVGLHFSVEDLMKVRKVAIPGALLQILVATLLGAGLGLILGWSVGGALVFGLALSVASTVVLLRALESQGSLESMNGQIAVGWLVVEDLVMVLALVLLPPLAGLLGGEGAVASGYDILRTLVYTFLSVSVFAALMLGVGRKIFPKVLRLVALTGSRELFTLSVIVAAVGIAYAASFFFGVSFALGAFFAGMVMGESEFSHRAAEESLPLREAFAVLFFVSVGMLFDPRILLLEPFQVLAVTVIILVGKSIAAAFLVIWLRYPLNTALTVAASLAQIGEFSFILASMGVSLGLLPIEGHNLILAGAIISIGLNPFLFLLVKPFEDFIRQRFSLPEISGDAIDPLIKLPDTIGPEFLSGQVILVGYGRVGRRIAGALGKHSIPVVVIEQNREIVEQLRSENPAALCGRAVDPDVLSQARIQKAAMLVIATPDTFDIRQVITGAKALNPQLEIIVRTHNEEDAALLALETAETIFFGEKELARSMAGHVLERFGKTG